MSPLRTLYLYSQLLGVPPYLTSDGARVRVGRASYVATGLQLLAYTYILSLETNLPSRPTLDGLVSNFGVHLLLYGAIFVHYAIVAFSTYKSTAISLCVGRVIVADSRAIVVRALLTLVALAAVMVLKYAFLKPYQLVAMDGLKFVLYMLPFATTHVVIAQFTALVTCLRAAFEDNEWNAASALRAMRVHHELCNVAMAINECYSPQLVIALAMSFISSIYALFYTYYFKIHLESNLFLVWLSMFVVILYQITQMSYICHQTENDIRNVGVKIHKLLLRTNNDALEDKLVLFSRQVAEYPIKFTAAGLFEINGSLVFAVIASAATYVLVMIQFLSDAEQNCSLRFV